MSFVWCTYRNNPGPGPVKSNNRMRDTKLGKNRRQRRNNILGELIPLIFRPGATRVKVAQNSFWAGESQ
jgi:hypothetical protein